MIYSEFFSWLIDEISFWETGIKPMEAIMWIIFLVITLLTVISLAYLNTFIDFGIKMILSAIFAAFLLK